MCATATVALPGGESWTIRRSGVWKPRVTVHRESTSEDLLGARAFWTGSYDLDEPVESAFRWGCFSMWRMEYGWKAFDGAPLIRYTPTAKFSHRIYRVEFDAAMPAESRLLLAVFGGYLLAVTHDDAAAAVAVVAG